MTTPKKKKKPGQPKKADETASGTVDTKVEGASSADSSNPTARRGKLQPHDTLAIRNK